MPTIVTHAVVGAALAQWSPPGVSRPRLALTLAVLSVFPDLDVVAFHFDVSYSHWLGHRGLSHSILFGVAVAAVVARVDFRRLGPGSHAWWRVFGLCAAAIVSHGLLDALTDGGLGIAFFLPFDSDRYFLPFRPLVVSPIGLANFVTGPIYTVLGSEILFVWAPLLALVALLRRRGRAPRAISNDVSCRRR